VAGTSAGAITACLFATREDLGIVRSHFQKQGAGYLKTILPRNFSPMSSWNVITLLRGYPLLNEKDVRTALAELFTTLFEKQYEKLEDLEMPVIVTATELMQEKAADFRAAGDSIAHVLLHSCGLPFVIKAPRNLTHHPAYVDGGICENLPSDALMKDGEGEVLGVSFREQGIKHDLGGVAGFAKSLMNAAINNSTQRARLALGDKVHLIETHIKTFDFEEALSPRSLNDHYDNVRAKTLQWIRETVSKLSMPEVVVIKPVEEIRPERDLQAKLYQVFMAQHRGDNNYQVKRLTMMVQANCLFPEKDTRHAMPDEITQETEFMVTSGIMYCIKKKIDSGGESTVEGDARFRLVDENHESHEVIALPVLDESQAKKGSTPSRHVIIYFSPPLKATDPPTRYTLIQRDRFANAMVKLRTTGTDHLSLTIDRLIAEKVELVLFVPENFPGMLAKQRPSDKPDKRPLPGRTMIPRELNRYVPPTDFRAIG
jgi:predicted acylesterase/phospholipase RssA